MMIIVNGFPVASLDWTSVCGVEGDCVVPPGCELPKHGASTIVKGDNIICVDVEDDAKYCHTEWHRYLPREWQIQGDSGRVNSWKLDPRRKMDRRDLEDDRMVLSYHGELIFGIPHNQTIVWNDMLREQNFVNDDPPRECRQRLRVFIQPHGSWAISNKVHEIWATLMCIVFMMALISCLCGCSNCDSNDLLIGYTLAGGFRGNRGYYND
tara:strand:+ start:1729 stop:2358 length:630 start_codon:yes stop_codon:yes gene_type:complete